MVTARHWLPGRSDDEAADYVQGLIGREGTAEFWAMGRTAIRQIKRVGALVEREGLAVMYLYQPDPGTQSRQFGMRVAPSLYQFYGSVDATRSSRA